jgi:hypothetical protein
MVEPRHVHLIATKHVLRYLKGTIDYGLRYVSDREISLQGYVDSDWAGSVSRSEEYIWMLLQFGISYDLMVQQEAN